MCSPNPSRLLFTHIYIVHLCAALSLSHITYMLAAHPSGAVWGSVFCPRTLRPSKKVYGSPLCHPLVWEMTWCFKGYFLDYFTPPSIMGNVRVILGLYYYTWYSVVHYGLKSLEFNSQNASIYVVMLQRQWYRKCISLRLCCSISCFHKRLLATEDNCCSSVAGWHTQ